MSLHEKLVQVTIKAAELATALDLARLELPQKIDPTLAESFLNFGRLMDFFPDWCQEIEQNYAMPQPLGDDNDN